jgi:hypothetical protein
MGIYRPGRSTSRWTFAAARLISRNSRIKALATADFAVDPTLTDSIDGRKRPARCRSALSSDPPGGTR